MTPRYFISAKLLCMLFIIVEIKGIAVKNVTIQKCCNVNEFMHRNGTCEERKDMQWKLKIFNPAKKAYLTKNVIPSNWNLKLSSRPRCLKPIYLSFADSKYVPFQNGSIFVVTYENLFHPMQYCIDYDAVLLCNQLDDEPENLVRIHKCCGKDALYSNTNKTCMIIKGETYSIKVDQNLTLGAGFPQCESKKLVIGGKVELEHDVLANGSVFLRDRNVMLPPQNYCLEHIFENAGRAPSVILCSDQPFATVNMNSYTAHWRFTVYAIFLAISAIFLAATLAAGYLMPAAHHLLHWRCQTNYVLCLLIGDVLLCISNLFRMRQDDMGIMCLAFATAKHFFFLAAFFWLNTMCFNIWWTFRDLRPQSVEKSQERCRLRLYEIYAWGVPLIFATLALLLDVVHITDSNIIRPGFGNNNCWFSGDSEILAFFFGPIAILLAVNLTLFALTARELTCGLWKRELVKSTTERAALGRICMKLVVVMGITWILDVVSWATGGPDAIWYLSDIINCLQGVFIFAVIGCQPQVLTAVKRIWCSRKNGGHGTAGTTNQHSSTSQGLPSMGDTMSNSITNGTTKSAVPIETIC